jgi:hypothetical protein
MTITDDGVFGLSLPNKDEAGTSIFAESFAQGLFKWPLFTTHLSKTNSSMITFGDFDSMNCREVEKWIPILSESITWQFKIDGFQLNGNSFDHPVQAMVDSGTSVLVVSSKALKALAKLTSAFYYLGKYVVDCRVKFSFGIKIQTQVYEIPSDELMFEVGRGYCQLAVNDGAEGLWSELWILGKLFVR